MPRWNAWRWLGVALIGGGALTALVLGGIWLAQAAEGPRGLAWPGRSGVYTDGAALRVSAAGHAPRQVLWSAPQLLETPLPDGADTYEPRLSWDEKQLFFVRGRPGENADLYVATRTPTGWSAAEPLETLNSAEDDLGAAPSADGSRLYFYSNRAGGSGGYDLWVARWADDAWQPPENLGPRVNSAYNDYGPALTPDGGLLYFASNRPVGEAPPPDAHGWVATVREDLTRRTYDLYTVPLGPQGPGTAIALDAFNTPANEGAPCVSPAGDFLYFASDRAGGHGGFDLYRAWRTPGAPGGVENLGDLINTSANELDPGLAQLGFGLYFSSDRPLAGVAQRAANETADAPRAMTDAVPSPYRLYYAPSREVFARREATPWRFDWQRFMTLVGPSLLWLLLALLLLLLLLPLWSAAQRRRLSLLARCLLASLLVHLLLLILLGFWKVGGGIADFLRGPGGVRVALLPEPGMQQLVTQLRGDLTSFTVPTAQASQVLPAQLELSQATALQTSFEMERVQAQVPDAARETLEDARVTQTATEIEITPVVPLHAVHTVAARVAQPEAAAPRQASETPRAMPTPPSDPSLKAAEAVLQVAATDVTVPQASAAARSDAPLVAPARGATPLASDARPTPREAATDVRPVALPVPAPASGLTVALPEGDTAPDAADETPVALPEVAARLGPAAALPALGAAPTPVRLAAQDARVNLAPQATSARDAQATEATPHGAAPLQTPVSLRTPAAATPLAVALPSAKPADDGATKDAAREATAPLPMPAMPANAPAAPLVWKHATDAAVADATPAAIPRTSLLPETQAERALPRDARHAATATELPPAIALAPVAQAALPVALPEPAPEQPAEAPPRGRLFGVVTDARTGRPLAEATIRVDQEEGEALTTATDAAGRYALALGKVPEHFAVSAGLAGFLPESRDVAAEALAAGPERVDFSLQPQSRSTLIADTVPEVHHLGNNRFEGQINSQFQRRSEGTRLTAVFELGPDQLPERMLRITLLAKGVQCPHDVLLNGELATKLTESPPDGSFGKFEALLAPRLLNIGQNALQIRTSSCFGDVDDFEFLNVQLHLDEEGAATTGDAADL